MIKAYSERVDTFRLEYAFIVVLWQVVQKLCADKNEHPWSIYRGFKVLTITHYQLHNSYQYKYVIINETENQDSLVFFIKYVVHYKNIFSF